MQIRHIGRGNFSAINDNGDRVGPVGTRIAVQAWIDGQTGLMQPVVEDVPVPPPAPAGKVDVAAYERMLSGHVRRETDKLSGLVLAALTPEVGEDLARAMVVRMEPILRDPTNQTRRRRMMRE